MYSTLRLSNSPWLGLSDLHTLGTYRWVTGATVLWDSWATGRPIKSFQTCVAWINGFYDDNCTASAHPFICQNATGMIKMLILCKNSLNIIKADALNEAILNIHKILSFQGTLFV